MERRRVAFSASSKWVLVGFLALLIGLVPSIGTAYGDTKYTVRPGDTLGGIALQHGVTVEVILAANNLSPGTVINTGQVLAMPTPVSNADTYVVQEGDHLTGVAQKFGLTVEELAAANGLSPTSYLYVGQVLRIPRRGQQPASTAAPQPAMTPTPSPTRTPTNTPQPPTATPTAGSTPGKPVEHVVQPGESLSSIALKYNTTIEELMRLNDLQDGNFLAVGQVLRVVPGNPAAPTATRTPIPIPTVPMGRYGPKWIDINLSTQTMIAFEGQTPVFTSRVSSGTYKYPTVQGTFRVYLKYRSQRMRGGQGTPDYYDIPNVPHVMYFYSGYALHGAYWHNNFGYQMSHGCVNLPLGVAQWMFEWAPIGTLVYSHR